MSFFGKIFGGTKEKPPTTGEAIQKLRETENMLNKKVEFLETKVEQEIQLAKKHGTKNKRAAIQALKRKKRYEKQLQQIDGTLSTIEMQREALESANTNTAVLTTMKSAAEALKHVQENMDVDKVHDIMDDISEQNDVAREISEAISNPINFGTEFDEDDLEKELEELEQEELDEKLLNVGPTTDAEPAEQVLPEVPTAAVEEKKVAKKTEPAKDKDLEELEAWAL